MLVSCNTCAWIFEHPVDMRKPIDALAVLVEPLFNANPLSGHLFVFLCRHRIRVKILYWDRTGFALWYKRLEGARFAHPGKIAKTGLNMAQLSAWLEGDPERAPYPQKSSSLQGGQISAANHGASIKLPLTHVYPVVVCRP